MDSLWKRVKSDCEELLSRFQRTDSVRFETFSEIWRGMKFSQIFYGTVKREKRVFSRLILDTACSFFLPPFSFQIRVGGLYLLYSLYGCQTASPPEQIRLALKDWGNVKKFEKDAVDAQHLDVVYILQQLMSQKAFCFTAMPTLLSYNKKRNVKRAALCEDFVERACGPQELINVELLEELANVHQLYEKLKTSVSKSAELSLSSISLIRNDPVSELRSTVVDFHKWQHEKDERDEVGDGGEGTSSQHECSRRAELLSSIKSKAFGQLLEASKSRRHRQVELDFTSKEEGPSQLSGYTRKNKLSLKARTKRDVHLSGDLWREAATRTHINRLTPLDFGCDEKSTRHQHKRKRRR